MGTDRSKDDDRLDSWKEIAAFVGRDTRTVARWEKSEGFPIHRHTHLKKHTVYAYKHEIEAWRKARSAAPTCEEATILPRAFDRPPRWVLLTACLATALAAFFAFWPATTGEGPRETAVGPSTFVVRKVLEETVPAESCFATDVTRSGDWIGCFDENSANVGVIDVASGRLRFLTERGSWYGAELATSGPRFSWSGENVAYTWRTRGTDLIELRVTDLFGGTRSIYHSDGIDTEPLAWTPDDSSIATVFQHADGNWELALISAIDGTARSLIRRGGVRPRDVAFSPDGRYLVYDNPSEPGGLSDLHLLDLIGGTTTRLTDHPQEDRFPVWLADGRGLFFISDRTGVVDAWLLPMNDDQPIGPPRLLQRDLGAVFPIALTDDGSLYYHLQVGLTEIYTADVDFETGRITASPRPFPTRLSGTNTQLVWSPDGTKAAWASRRGWSRRWTVVVHDFATGEEQAIGDMRYARKPEWSPSGRSLLVRGTDASDRSGTFEIDARSGAAIGLVLPGMRKTAEWGGDAILYTDGDERRGTGGIYRLRREEGTQTSLYATEPGSTIGRLLAVSRDKQQIAFTLVHRPTQTRRLMVMPSLGGPATELLVVHEPESILVQDFTTDGRFVLFIRRGQSATGKLYRASVETGEALPINLVVEDARSVSVHPNGKTIAFTTGRPVVELYVLENALPAFVGSLLAE